MKNIIEKSSLKSMTQTVIKMVPPVLTALLATALGFLALYTSPVPMIQDFGKMLTIGMIVSFLIGLFITIPILYTRDRFFFDNKEKTKEKKNRVSKFESILERFTIKIVSYKWAVIMLALLTAGAGIWADLNTRVETDIETFMPQETQALKDIHKLRDVIGTTDQVSIVFKSEDVLSEESILWIDKTTQSLKSEFPDTIVDTKSITSVMRQLKDGNVPNSADIEETLDSIPKEQLKLLVNEDRTKGVITVGIKHLEANNLKNFIESLNSYLDESKPANLDITVTGKSVLDVEMVSALTTGRYKMTLLGMAAVFLGLLLIYRNLMKAFIPLLPIIFIVGWSGAVMYLFNIKYTPLTATLGALIIGIGTEFTILIMERFYEERKKGKVSIDAIAITSKKIGKAIFASALTTIGGFAALLVSDFKILSNFGMMTLINISFALISTLVVMPAILMIFDKDDKNKNVEVKETEASVG